jgi:muconolactone D-isomerase
MPLFAVLATQSPRGISGDEYRRRLPAGYEYVQRLAKKGVIMHNWIRVGASGGLHIYEIDSHEQLLNILYSNPISPHLSYEVIPLAAAGSFDPTSFEEDHDQLEPVTATRGT